MYKVLVLAYYFPPKGLSGVQRALKFVKYMPEFGWEPTVITSGINAYYAYDESLLADLDGKNIRIIRPKSKEVNSLLTRKGTVKMPPEFWRKFLSYLSAMFFLPDNKKSWARAAFREAKTLMQLEQFDLIFVTGPPFSAFRAGKDLKSEFGIPVVYDYRDLWHDNHFSKMPTPVHRIINRRMEYNVLKKADKIIVINRRIKEKIMHEYKFLQHRDITIIPHGFDKDDIARAGIEPKHQDRMILTYSGLFYENITPKYLLKAFKLLLKEHPEIASNIHLQFIGVLRKSVFRMIQRLQLQSSVITTGYLPHLDALRKIKTSDVLWVMMGKSKNADTVSTSKVYEYIGTGKPIIGFTGKGVMATLLTEYGAGYLCDPEDIQEIKAMLARVYNDYQSKKMPIPRQEEIDKYDRRNLTELLTKEFLFAIQVK